MLLRCFLTEEEGKVVKLIVFDFIVERLKENRRLKPMSKIEVNITENKEF